METIRLIIYRKSVQPALLNFEKIDLYLRKYNQIKLLSCIEIIHKVFFRRIRKIIGEPSINIVKGGYNG